MLHTDKQTDRQIDKQTNKQTDKRWQKHSLLGGDKYEPSLKSL